MMDFGRRTEHALTLTAADLKGWIYALTRGAPVCETSKLLTLT